MALKRKAVADKDGAGALRLQTLRCTECKVMVPLETLSACNGPAACPFAQAQRVREEQSMLREKQFVPSPLVAPRKISRGSSRAQASSVKTRADLQKTQLYGDSSSMVGDISMTMESRHTLERQNDAVGAAALLEGTAVEPWVQQRARVRGKFPLRYPPSVARTFSLFASRSTHNLFCCIRN